MATQHKASAFQRTTILMLLLLSLAVLAAQPIRAQSGSGQEVLTNESIIKMVKAEVGENVILQMIDSHPGNYNMTADGVVQLKQQGVPENIISAMMVKGPASSNSPAAPAGPAAHASSSPSSSSGPACPSQLGAYYLDGASWKPMSQVMTEGSSAHVKPIPFATSAKGVLRFRDPAAPITLGETPKFCLRGNMQFSRNIVIAVLDVKSDHREVETVHIGQYSGAKTGIPTNKIQPIDVQATSDSSVDVSTRGPLRPGQYMIFPLGQGGMGYDFGVSGVR